MLDSAGGMTPEPRAFEDAGLYDPSAPDADERLEILRYLVNHGLTIEEIAAADQDNLLPVAAADRLIKGGHERLTLDEVAQRIGESPETVLRLWRADGFPDPGDAAIFTEDDFAGFPVFGLGAELLGEEMALQLARVIGTSIARIAEAEVATLAHGLADPVLVRDGNVLGLIKTSVHLMTMLPGMAHIFDRIHRHHLEAALRRLIFATEGFKTSIEQAHLSVGFADLTGYTALAQRLRTDELAHALASFEAIAHDVVTQAGGRVVKLIGDEVMFAAPASETTCAIALGLHDRVASEDALPPLRTAIAAGEVLARDGDYYGPVVNVASRAAAIAAPGQVLITQDVVERAEGAGFLATPIGAYPLKGFDEPVELFELTRGSS